jgi:glycerol kinase
MPFILAIDQSTSATKAVWFDADGRCLDRAVREHRQIHPRPGWVEHDLDEIWRNTLAVVRELVGRHTDQLEHLAGVSVTNQRETIAVFERISGRPLANAIVWQCRRGEGICRELVDAGCEPRLKRLTGLRLDTYFSAPKLKWMVHEMPGLKAKLVGGEAVVGTMDTWLIHRLTGGRVLATDSTNACRTLLFDFRTLQWDPWLCDLFDVPPGALPEVRPSTGRFGETTFDGLLARPVPICGVMGDSHASLFAQRCYHPGMAKVTLGTGSSVLLNIGSEPRDSKGGSVSTLAWVDQDGPVYAFEGIINCSAVSIAWLKDSVGLLERSRDAADLAAAVPDNGGVYLVPAFAGLGAPHWRPDARAAIVGLTMHSTRHHLVRAAEESIAYQLRDVLQMMRDEAAVPLRSIRVDGGPTRDQFLMQFTADMLGIELEVADLTDGSAQGAALAGLLGLGLRSTLEELAALPRTTVRYEPRMDVAMVNRNAAGWAAALKRVLLKTE